MNDLREWFKQRKRYLRAVIKEQENIIGLSKTRSSDFIFRSGQLEAVGVVEVLLYHVTQEYVDKAAHSYKMMADKIEENHLLLQK